LHFLRFKKIVLVGPQGIGKTTQALLLRLWLRKVYQVDVCVKRHVHYTMLHKVLLHIAVKAAKLFGRIELVKFYRDEPPVYSPSREVFRAFFPFLVCVYIAALAVDSTLFRIHAGIFLDDEGFVFKQVADLYYLARRYGLLSSKPFRLFLRLAIGLIRKLNFNLVVFQVRDYRVLVDRYVRQKASASWRRVEPEDYINLQQAVYNRIAREAVHACFVNAQQNLLEVFEEVLKCLRL